ncbi:MAG TPA: alpha-2-macroglobulin family protein, partial [Kofleriaceae bacterium]|nr:alpha-2-macroglobulin family protein [Kofleriaceae bacterium]
MKKTLAFRGVAVATLAQFLAVSCGGQTKPPPAGPGSGAVVAQPGGQPLIQVDTGEKGLVLRLSDGKQGAPAADRSKLAPAKSLGDAEVASLLSRLAPVAVGADDVKAFALRDRSTPRPRTGTTIRDVFPGPSMASRPPVASDAGKPLEVVRFAPEGDVKIAPMLQVTFSAPMVAVTSQDDAATVVPVTLTPTPPGRWRWLGTKTLVFDPQIRFPMATTYSVAIAGGTKSVNGNVLAAAKTFTFTTPTPRVVSSWPGRGPQRLDAPMFVLFDQKVDAAAVLATVKVTAARKTYGVRPLTDDEIAKDETLARLVETATKNEHAGRWIAFRADAEFPKSTDVTVTIGPGTPSLEGPNRTKDRQTFAFETYSPLKIVRAECAWRECPPGAPFSIELNNPLDEKVWTDASITITPDLARAKIHQNANYVTIMGPTRAQTTYKTRLAGGIVDRFGQTLGKDAELEWKVGKPMPNLFGPTGMIALDPGAKAPTLDVFTTSYDALKVQLYEVKPTDWEAYGYYMQHQWERKKPRLPGKKVMDELVRIGGSPNELAETKIELARALGRGGFGHVIAIVEPSPWKERHEPPRLITWVQSTRIGLDAAVDATDMKAWVNRLADGAPLGGVELTMLPWGIAAKSDDTGMATLALSATAKKGANLLVAKQGDDVAFLPDDYGWYGEYGQWQKQSREDGITWHITDDRQMYKPGEEVHLKGWLRAFQNRKGGDLAGVAGRVSAVTYRVVDRVGNELLKGSARLSALGGFDTRFTLPKTANLGYATVNLETEGALKATGYHGFQIQEFRRPEYEVSAEASQGPHLIGESADVTVKASYFAGGGLQGADVTWYLTAAESSYTPPNRDEWTFGVWVPWWGWRRGWWEDDDSAYAPQKTWTHTAKTDATGAHVLHLDLVSANPPVPMSVSANASVVDVNRQVWTANTTLLVHPSSLYVGLKTEKPFVEKGQPIDVAAIAVDLDGKAIAGRVLDISSVRLDWEVEKGTYVQKELDPQACAPTSTADAVTCAFATPEGGQYRIRALVADDQGRANKTELTVWVTGGDVPPARDVQQEIAQLIPDKQEYKHGDTAEILVQTPFYPAEGILSVRRSGLLSTERFTMTGPTQTVKVPIVDSHTPNVYVQIDLVGQAARTDDDGNADPSLPKRPAYATGQLNLPVPPRARTLAVEVTPKAKKVGPGEAATFDVFVKDAAGRPVPGAEVALVVVDEAVLSLTGFQFANPIQTFYGERGADTRDHHLRGFVRLAQPDAGKLAMDGHGGDRDGDAVLDEEDSGEFEARNGWSDITVSTTAVTKNEPARPRLVGKKAEMSKDTGLRGKGRVTLGGLAQPPPPIAVRTNFDPLAAFAPEVKTGADGRASVDVKMPDNLTRYRVVALAASGEKNFGKGESAITARLPLMVRPSAPRFLNFGDTFELPVVLQNQTDAPMEVKVAVRATNATITKGAGRVVKVPANDRVEVRFPAAAALPGTARFQLAATAGTGAATVSDAAEVALPVWAPATTEAFATYGQIDGGGSVAIKQPVALPGKVVAAFGGVEVETSSTQLQALTDAFLYVVAYPFECSEQLSSRIAGISALRDVLGAFKAKDLPSPAALEARVGEDLERLYSMQNHDGGFPFWQRGHESWPYLTVHVTNAMVRAKAKGFTVEKAALDNALAYLGTIERRYPHWYSDEVKRTITSYALYTRMLAGDRDVARAKGLIKEAGGVPKLPMEAVGWLLGVLAGQADASAERAAILRHVANNASETAAAASFTTSYRDGGHLLLASDRRVDAVILESLIAEEKTSDLIPKIVVGLLAHQKAGKWANTQENVFALAALDRYFHEYEKVTPDFVARVWLGDGYAGEHSFKGRTTERHAIDIPMAEVAKRAATSPADLVIQKDGAGRLYYRVGMTYAPADLKLAAADYGFTVVRKYEPIDNPKDVVHDADGTWRIKAGARVRVRLSMVAENRRYHVALVDPLP